MRTTPRSWPSGIGRRSLDGRPLSAGADASGRNVENRSPWVGAESVVPHEETLSRVVSGMDADAARTVCGIAPLVSCVGAERPRLFREGLVSSGAFHDESTGPIGVEDGRDIGSAERE